MKTVFLFLILLGSLFKLLFNVAFTIVFVNSKYTTPHLVIVYGEIYDKSSVSNIKDVFSGS